MEKQTFTTTKEVKPDSVNIIQLQSCRFKPAFLNQFQSEMCLLLQQYFSQDHFFFSFFFFLHLNHLSYVQLHLATTHQFYEVLCIYKQHFSFFSLGSLHVELFQVNPAFHSHIYADLFSVSRLWFATDSPSQITLHKIQDLLPGIFLGSCVGCEMTSPQSDHCRRKSTGRHYDCYDCP